VSPLWRRPATSSSEDIAKLLRTARVQQAGRGGTLMTAPVIVACGKHRGDFQLFARDGTPIGMAVAERRRSYEIRDTEDRCVLRLQEVGASWEVLGYRKWRYEVVPIGDSGPIHVSRLGGRTLSASVTEGSRPIAMMRFQRLAVPGTPALELEDDTGHAIARVHIPRVSRVPKRVDLVLEIPAGTSHQLRALGLAAGLIAERELVHFGDTA
jgi:hypothetical protein